MKKIICFLAIILGMLNHLHAQNDFFPLDIGNEWNYDYNSIEHEYFDIAFLAKTTIDSGLVQYKILDSSLEDSLIVWTIQETANLRRHIQNFYENKDTTFNFNFSQTFQLKEYLDSNHTLKSESYFDIFSFPIKWSHWGGGIVSNSTISRYDSSEAFLEIEDGAWAIASLTASLSFQRNIGLTKAVSSIYKGPNTPYIFDWEASLQSYSLPSKNYFPLEIGNRWDYSITTQSHGGNFSHSKLSVEVIGKAQIKEKDYFKLSNNSLFESEYLRLENDSLYCLKVEDSTDCLIFAFDQILDSFYYSCKYDSVLFTASTDFPNFGEPDLQQRHSAIFKSIEFSKKFGMVNSDDWSGLTETWHYLSGCVISGTAYGILLDIGETGGSNINTFQLYQNYPNPFNPITTINYSIPKTSHVSLKVYDILGREIAILVDEENTNGNYSIEFNSKNLPSGIYFYSLLTNEFTETKKMVLLR